MTKIVEFTKMHGLGNDYIYVDVERFPLKNPSALSRLWSASHSGIGSDGLVLIGKSEKADFSMRIFNADGSEAMMCGNASRCIGKYVYEHGLTLKKEITLETLSGLKRLELFVDEEDRVVRVTVDMGLPRLAAEAPSNQLSSECASLVVGNETVEGTFVSMGNPHWVVFTPTLIDDMRLREWGPMIEHYPLFPSAVNVEFAHFVEKDRLRMRVWERGSGITMACGTGACATAVAAMAVKDAPRKVTVEMDGGELSVEWREDGHVYMTGGATEVFRGWIGAEE